MTLSNKDAGMLLLMLVSGVYMWCESFADNAKKGLCKLHSYHENSIIKSAIECTEQKKISEQAAVSIVSINK